MSKKREHTEKKASSNQLSRRDFIKGAAAGAAGIAALGIFGGCNSEDKGSTAVDAGQTVPSTSASDTVLNAAAAESANPSSDIPKTAGTYEWETAPDPIAEEEITEEIKADIVIVGAGFSGLCCALKARQDGASVILLDRLGRVIGRGGSIFAINTKLLKEKGYSIDVGETYKRMMGYHSYRVDGRKWMKHAHYSGEAMDWLIDLMTSASEAGGNDLTPVLEHWYEDPQNINGEFPGTHEFLGGPNGLGPDDNPQQDVCDNLAAYCQEAGVEIYYETKASQLVKDDSGRVTSVVAVKDKRYIKFTAEKGVVMATGDFGADQEMLAKYIPWALQAGSGGVWEGSGHKMAYWAGAAADKSETPAPMIFCFQWRSITRQVRAFQGLMVNSDGLRYTNEDNVISHGALALMHEKGHHAFAIWDTDYASEPQWKNHRYVDGPPVFETKEEVIAYWDEIVASSGTIDMNGSGALEVKMMKADTIEELIQLLELPLEQTTETIERYNGFCANGVDEDFDKRSELLLPIQTGPFYGIKCTPWFLSTTGGIRCNADMQVLDADNNIIKGLYCLGSMVGDMYCNCYSTHFPGHNLGAACLTFGYLTGQKLAGE